MAWLTTPDEHRDAATDHYQTAEHLRETGARPDEIQRHTEMAYAQLTIAQIKEN